MRTTTWLGYLLLLVAAFVIGLVGTVAASQALVSAAAARNKPAMERTQKPAPAQLPASTPPVTTLVPTVEC